MFQGIGQDIPQIQPMQFNIPAPKKRGGMFGNADWGSAVAAALGGFAAGMGNPAGAHALQALHSQRMMRQRAEAEEQQYQRQRTDGMSDWVAREQWKLQNDQPDYGEFERALIASGVQPGTPQWQQMMQRRRDNMLDPIVNTAYGPVLRSAVTGGQGLPQTLSDEDFGGPAASPPATFPFRF